MMHTIQVLDATDVLLRARDLIALGPLKNPRAGDGAYCPWCAIAQAKGELSEEYGTSGDGALEMAQVWLGFQDEIQLTQAYALEKLDKALELAR